MRKDGAPSSASTAYRSRTETLPMDIWSGYMASATAEDLALEFPEADASELYTVDGGTSSGF